jgi:signal transduction histidine kinase
MKNRFLIWLSALALLVLVSVQYVFITETYITKQKLIDGRYGALVRQALSEFDNEEYNFAFDSVLYLLDNLALEYQFANPDTLEMTCPEAFQQVLDNFREPEEYIREFVRKAGEEPEITYHLQINELFLLDMGYEQRVYPDSVQLPLAPARAVKAGSYIHERNFYRISYEVYINFTKRTQIILREMWLILSLSVVTLFLVFTVYYLTFRNMNQQRKMSERKTDFINNMTHELKTPLSTISVASSTLESVMMDGKKVEELSALIKKQNRHLSELIDRILDINIWERDQVKLKRQPVETEKWIRGLVDAFLVERNGGSVDLHLHLDPPGVPVFLDEVHMATAVNNLLGNAVKYGNKPCRIDLSLKHEEGNMVLIVTDDGPGIRKEDLRHIFEKFFRGKESKERVIKGLGLGLYYVKQIVEAHGGTVTVNSIPGKGTQFNMIIPIENGHSAG